MPWLHLILSIQLWNGWDAIRRKIINIKSSTKLQTGHLFAFWIYLYTVGCNKISKGFQISILTWCMLYLYERRPKMVWVIDNVIKIIIYFIFIKGGNPFPNPLCTRRSWGMRPGRFCGSLIDLPAPAPPYNFYTKLLFCSLYHCILRAHTKPPYIYFSHFTTIQIHQNTEIQQKMNIWIQLKAMIWIKGKVS